MRNIFWFTINEQEKAVDPLAALRALWLELPNYDQIHERYSKEAESEADPQSLLELQGQLIQAARVAFHLPEFSDGEGYLDDEVLTVLWAFHDWLEKKSPPPVNQPKADHHALMQTYATPTG